MTTLKYEVAVDGRTGIPLFFSGPFAGPTADITVFRSSLKHFMEINNFLGLADGSYQGEPQLLLTPPRGRSDLSSDQLALSSLLSRYRVLIENLYARLKDFDILSTKFRSPLDRHRPVFSFILNCITVDLCEHPLRINN